MPNITNIISYFLWVMHLWKTCVFATKSNKTMTTMKAIAMISSESLTRGGYNFRFVYVILGRIQSLLDFWAEVSVPLLAIGWCPMSLSIGQLTISSCQHQAEWICEVREGIASEATVSWKYYTIILPYSSH